MCSIFAFKLLILVVNQFQDKSRTHVETVCTITQYSEVMTFLHTEFYEGAPGRLHLFFIRPEEGRLHFRGEIPILVT
jgi:hypothetical protein